MTRLEALKTLYEREKEGNGYFQYSYLELKRLKKEIEEEANGK